MKIPKPVLTALLALAGLTACSDSSRDEFVSIFNGRDLTGWEGGDRWSVVDGVITGKTVAEDPLEANTFLIYAEERPANFELRLQYRISAQNDRDWANSGIQYRSRRIGGDGYAVGGYQTDIDLAGQYLGMLYEERGRGLVMEPGQRIRLTASGPGAEKDVSAEVLEQVTEKGEILSAYNKGGWNEIRIVADGNHLRHYLNGTLTADVTDDDQEHAAAAGLIALQLHRGEPMTIEFKDIEIKLLD